MKTVGDELPINERIYESNPDQSPPLISSIIAIFSLFLYCCWPQICLLLLAMSLFFRWALLLVILLLSTLVIPAKPLLWKPFTSHYVFKTWRQYFSFSFLFEERWVLGSFISCLQTLMISAFS